MQYFGKGIFELTRRSILLLCWPFRTLQLIEAMRMETIALKSVITSLALSGVKVLDEDGELIIPSNPNVNARPTSGSGGPMTGIESTATGSMEEETQTQTQPTLEQPLGEEQGEGEEIERRVGGAFEKLVERAQSIARSGRQAV